MKRLHISLGVEDFKPSVDFYATLFGANPDVLKDNYAKWMLDNPCINFVIDNRSASKGVDHLGIQVDSAEELDELATRLKAAGAPTEDQTDAACCYAKSDKTWTRSPDGLIWETFLTHGANESYGTDTAPRKELAAAAEEICCG